MNGRTDVDLAEASRRRAPDEHGGQQQQQLFTAALSAPGRTVDLDFAGRD